MKWRKYGESYSMISMKSLLKKTENESNANQWKAAAYCQYNEKRNRRRKPMIIISGNSNENDEAANNVYVA